MRTFLLALVILTAPVAAASVDFTAPAVAAPFKLSDARGQFVALHFLLKTECPYCLKHTQAYTTRAAEVPGVVQVFLKPDEPAEILMWLAKIKPAGEGDRPLIYQDAGGKIADQLKIPGGYQFHGQTMHYPALVIIDRDGSEAFRYVGKNNTDRYPFDSFKERIAELSADAKKEAKKEPTP